MSADLFAAFGSSHPSQQIPQTHDHTKPAPATSHDPFAFPAQPADKSSSQPVTPWPSTQQPNSCPFARWPTTTQQQQPQPPHEDEGDDAWGDFEEAPKPPSIAPQSTSLANLTAPAEPEPDPLPRTSLIRVPTLELATNGLVHLQPFVGSSPIPPPSATLSAQNTASAASTAKQTPKARINQDPNVLFDAEDFDLQEGSGNDEGAARGAEDDASDFGGFQAMVPRPAAAIASAPSPAPALAQVPSQAMADLVSLDWDQPPPGPQIAATTSIYQTRRPATRNLLVSIHPLDNKTGMALYPRAPKSPFESFHDRKPDAMKQLSVKTPLSAGFPDKPRTKTPSPVTVWPDAKNSNDVYSPEEEWAEFGDLPSAASDLDKANAMANKTTASSPRKNHEWSPTAKPSKPVGWEWTGWEEADGSPTSAGPPPTNVPPPSILLSVFPPLLEVASTSLMKPLSSQPPAVRDRVLSDPATVRFLRGYLALATVAARIVAGRKMRWHRDKFLSQGMAISAAGAKGGMKLSAIDKSQSTREDREAEDVLTVWRQHVGPLRSAVAAANAAKGGGGGAATALKVPELGGPNLAAHPAGANAGVAAPRACALCGLKRDERVARVDFDVEDSFGEWWVEHWGHRTCRNWWARFEGRLRQR